VSGCVVVESGPGDIRRLCGGTADLVVDPDMVVAALESVDDAVSLVDTRPVSVSSLWAALLATLVGEQRESVILVVPSWWTASRVDVVEAAARTVAADVVTRRRSWLLEQASLHATAVLVEIAPQFVVVTGQTVMAERRAGDPDGTADAVVRAVLQRVRGRTAVLIDGPAGVGGAAVLATLVADRLLASTANLDVALVDDARLRQLAAGLASGDVRSDPEAGDGGRTPVRHGALTAFAVLSVAIAGVLAAASFGAGLLGAGLFDEDGATASPEMPMTFLVEGRIAMEIPEEWAVRRVTDGPGSARVQVMSPLDPDVALHVTQSRVPDKTLSDTAESLRRAADTQPAGVFVDFNPADQSGGRPAVTYREVRAGHDIRWTVLLDGSVRISIGCQSPPGGESAVHEVCGRAIRSARVLGRTLRR